MREIEINLNLSDKSSSVKETAVFDGPSGQLDGFKGNAERKLQKKKKGLNTHNRIVV